MFRSARLKLTLFYLVILLAFSLTATIGIRLMAEHEYNNSNYAQRNEVRRLFVRPLYGFGGPSPVTVFSDAQEDQAAAWRDRLNKDLAIINVFALVLGGLFSYWFAGRTLRPIEESHEAQKRFAADASHELRTPLTNMKLENEIFLRQKDFSKPEARELIQSNLEEVQRLEHLSSSLLDLTRYGNDALTLAPLSIQPVVNKTLHQIRKAASAKKITVTHDTVDAVVQGNADSLTQLLDIVLDNAIKYGPQGAAVHITGRKKDDVYVLQVTDTGPGIDPDDLPYIFDRLYRGDKARSGKTQGYGLGLALARQIAEANRGSISARNVKGKGARFELRLALAK